MPRWPHHQHKSSKHHSHHSHHAHHQVNSSASSSSAAGASSAASPARKPSSASSASARDQWKPRWLREVQEFLASPIRSLVGAPGDAAGGVDVHMMAMGDDDAATVALDDDERVAVGAANKRAAAARRASISSDEHSDNSNDDGNSMVDDDHDSGRPKVHRSSATFDLNGTHARAANAANNRPFKSPPSILKMNGKSVFGSKSKSHGSSSLSASLTPVAERFNGNQWIDRFGRAKTSTKPGAALLHGAAAAAAAGGKHSSSKPKKHSDQSLARPVPVKTQGRSAAAAPRSAVAGYSAAAAAAASAAAAAGGASRPVVTFRPISSASASSAHSASKGSRWSGSAPSTPVPPSSYGGNTPSSFRGSPIDLSAGFSSAFLWPDETMVPASASSAAGASSSAAAGSSAASGSSLCALAAHPLSSYSAPNAHALQNRSGSSSSSTQRKRSRPAWSDQEDEDTTKASSSSRTSSSSSASAATGNTYALHYTQHYSGAPSQTMYIHFRLRFRHKATALAIMRARFRGYAAAGPEVIAASQASGPVQTESASSAAASLIERRGVGGLNSAAPRGLNVSKGKKEKGAAATPYQDLRAADLMRHTCTQPHKADWLWNALQHRTTFSSIDNYELAISHAASGGSSSASAATSSSSSPSSAAPSSLSAYFSGQLLSHSTVKPYYQFQECEENGTLRLFTGLRPLVRYHRIRGLVASGKKGAQSSSASKSGRARMPDFILESLYELRQRGQRDDSDDDMEDESSARNLRARAGSVAASTFASLSHFQQLLHDTTLIPHSLNTPSSLLNDYQPGPHGFQYTPLSLQLMVSKYLPVLPAVFHDISRVKPKNFVFQPAPAGWKIGSAVAAASNSSKSLPGEEDWIRRNEKQLPVTHRRLLRLFYSHVKLPIGKESSQSSAAASASPPSSLHDTVYHFNLTAFASCLLYQLYQTKKCHKFVLSVDSLSDRLPTYYRDQVKNPLSLYDIDMRVVCGYYDSLAEVLSDIWRCCENTMLFHYKPFHAHVTETKAAAEDRSTKEGDLSREMVDDVASIWKDIRSFIDKHYITFMSHQPVHSTPASSPRLQSSALQSGLSQIRRWMDEVAGREVQTLRLLWIAQREVERPLGRIPIQPVGQWREFHVEKYHKMREVDSDDDDDGRRSDDSDDSNEQDEDEDEDDDDNSQEDDSSDDDSGSDSDRPRKKQKLNHSNSHRPASSAAAAAASSNSRFRSDSPALRATRLHPSSNGTFDPLASFPPLCHSRSQGGRHSRNLPPAIVRKLGRRAGKVPYGYDAKWFYVSKLD